MPLSESRSQGIPNIASDMAGVNGRDTSLLSQQYLLHNAVYNVLDYGADNTGNIDISPAITKILIAKGNTPSVLYFPAGTYLLPDYNFGSVSNLIVRGDNGMTTITGGSRSVPQFTNPSLFGLVSRRIVNMASATNVVFQDIIFDGAQPAGPTFYAGSYTNVQALIEGRSCSRIRLQNCTVINFTPVLPSNGSGGQENPDHIEWTNQGPVFFNGCDDVKLFDMRLITPCYGEGFVLINCTRYFVERMFANSGQLTSLSYGTSTYLHCVGPSSQYGTIRDNHFYKSNGSSLEVGSGLGMIDVLHNVVDSGGGFNIALANVGYYSDYDITGIGLRVNGNKFENTLLNANSHIQCINIGARVDGGFQYQDVQVHDNIFDSVFSAISVRGCQDVSIQGNRASRVYVPSVAPGGSDGIGISVIGCAGVVQENNVVDMQQIANGGAAGNRGQYGFLTYDSDDVLFANNQTIDASTGNFRLGVQDRWKIPFTAGGTALRDMLWNQVWLGTAYMITGATSGATMSVQGRVKTSGDFAAGTAAGYIYGFSKVGTFTVGGENLTLNAVTLAAHASSDAVFASWMNRISVHDNQSVTFTTTVAPYFIQPVGTNAMVGQFMRCNNQHNGAYIDPLDVAANIGDADITVTNFSLPTIQCLTARTANRTYTIPASPAFNGQRWRILIGAAGAFTVTVRTDTPTTLLVIPANAQGYFEFQYNSGWRCIMQSYFPLAAALATSPTTLTDQAGVAAGTLTNAPTIGNPTKWVAINDNGTIRKIPTWT